MERLPIRVNIRKNILVETSHIMVLVDDFDKTLIEPLYNEKNNLEILYSTELLENGG